MSTSAPSRLVPLPRRPLLVLLGAQALVLTAQSGRYGYHRDELYFRAAGHHLAWGYADQPPLTPFLARVSTTLFGDTVMGLRVVATLMALGTALLAAVIARELGARSSGQLVAATLTATGGYVLAIGHMLSTGSADLLIQLGLLAVALRLVRTTDPRWFVPLGALIGLGMLNKFLVAMTVVSLLVGFVIAGPRPLLSSRWLVAGIAVAGFTMAPTIIWQATHGWPQLTVARGIGTDDGTMNRLMLLPQHALLIGPVIVPVWITGLVRLLRSVELRWARFCAVAYLVALVSNLAAGGKFYYLVPLLLVPLAAGAQPCWDWTTRRGLRRLAVGLVAVGMLINGVMSLPLLPARAATIPNAMNREQGAQVGWPTLVDDVARAWQQIPVGERGRAVILTRNYGEAGAIDRYGPAKGLPRPYSGHMSWYDWGPPSDSMNGPVLVVRTKKSVRPSVLTGCRTVHTIDNGVGLDTREQGAVIELCRGTTEPWSRIWPRLRQFY